MFTSLGGGSPFVMALSTVFRQMRLVSLVRMAVLGYPAVGWATSRRGVLATIEWHEDSFRARPRFGRIVDPVLALQSGQGMPGAPQ